MSADTTDVLAADTTDVLPADTTHVLPADTTHVLPADNPGFLWKNQKSCNPNLGIWVRKNGIFPWEAGFYYETWAYCSALDIVRFCGPGYGYPWDCWL